MSLLFELYIDKFGKILLRRLFILLVWLLYIYVRNFCSVPPWKKLFYLFLLFYTMHIITILILYIANWNIFHYKLDFFFILYLFIHVSLFLVPEVILWNIFYTKKIIYNFYIYTNIHKRKYMQCNFSMKICSSEHFYNGAFFFSFLFCSCLSSVSCHFYKSHLWISIHDVSEYCLFFTNVY